MSPEERGRLAAGAREIGIELSGAQLDLFASYQALLYAWNERLNLTRVPPREAVARHFLDSLAAARAFDLAAARRLIDVGTGAGLPGIPLKIACPGLHVTLLDATRKKLAFLDEAIVALGLGGIVTVHARAEDACRQPEHRARYDVAVARAVGPLGRLAGWLLPLVRPGGVAVALKSANVDGEVADAAAAIRTAGGRLTGTLRVRIPGEEVERTLVCLAPVTRAPGQRPKVGHRGATGPA